MGVINMQVNFKREINGTVESVLPAVEKALQVEGFGVLTRIDFHHKIKEKLHEELPPTVILGACNPKLAFEAWKKSTDITSMIPCNVVVREVGVDRVSVEIARPSAMMELLGDKELVAMTLTIDVALKKVLQSI